MRRVLRGIVAVLVSVYALASYASTPNITKLPTPPALAMESRAVGKYLAADYAFRHNHIDEAAKLYEEALELSPHNGHLIQNTFKSYLFAGKLSKAVTYANRFLHIEPQSPSASIIVVTDHIAARRYDDALALINTISYEGVQPHYVTVDKVIVPFFKIWLECTKSDCTKSHKVLTKLNSKNALSKPFYHLLHAMMYDVSGDYDNAAPHYEKAIKLSTQPYHYIHIIGNFFERNGQHEKAASWYRYYRKQHKHANYFEFELQRATAGKTIPAPLVASIQDGINEVLMEAVRILYKSNLVNEALAYLRLIQHINPKHEESKFLMAAYFERVEAYELARRTYESIDRKSDFYWSARESMAENLYKLGKKNKAKRQLLSLIKRSPNQLSPMMRMADLLRGDKKYHEAIKYYSMVIESIDPLQQQYWPIFFARGISYEQLGKWEQAEEDLLHALNLDNNQPEVLNYLGYSWIDQNKYIPKAKNLLFKAVKARPEDPQIIDSVGWVLFKLDQYEQASSYIERALELEPNDTVINEHLGDVYWKMGRVLEARFQWKRALKFMVKDDPARESELNKKIKYGLAD